MNDIGQLFKEFVDRMNASSLFRQAARGRELTIQFRIVPAVHRVPLNAFAGRDGEWWCIVVRDSTAELFPEDRRATTNLRRRVEYECERAAAEQILRGESTISRALLEDRLVAGGVLAHYGGTLLHLANCGNDLSRFLPSGQSKAFLG